MKYVYLFIIPLILVYIPLLLFLIFSNIRLNNKLIIQNIKIRQLETDLNIEIKKYKTEIKILNLKYTNLQNKVKLNKNTTFKNEIKNTTTNTTTTTNITTNTTTTTNTNKSTEINKINNEDSKTIQDKSDNIFETIKKFATDNRIVNWVKKYSVDQNTYKIVNEIKHSISTFKYMYSNTGLKVCIKFKSIELICI